MDSHQFIQSEFTRYYKENSDKIGEPKSIEKREFGFILFKEKVMVRHKSFANQSRLGEFISSISPVHAYYSTAYYEAPEAKMEEKGWLGADLFFDIDADHIPSKCNKNHDTWLCKNWRVRKGNIS